MKNIPKLFVYLPLKILLPMRRIYVICFLLASIAVQMRSQDLVVQSFSMDETDLTANTSGTIVIDRDGKKCALIKVESKTIGLSFDAGQLGIVKTEQKVGEVWVYVPEGVKRFTISHPKYGIIKDYDLGQTLKRARTYILKLAVSGELVEEIDQRSQYVIFRLTPKNAIVIIDGDTLQTDNGIATKKMDYGTYDYRVLSSGYQPEVGKITIDNSENNKMIDVKLTSMIEKSVEHLSGDSNYRIVKIGKVEYKMIFVDGGTFQHAPLNPYYIGETEVTQELWNAVMGKKSNPSYNVGKNNPVDRVSWEDCQDFIDKLNQMTGLTFRLPTEAEWEFAACGGNKSHGYKYSGSNLLGEVGWYMKNSLGETHEVKTMRSNELGLYDMSGNVREWCANWYENYLIEDPMNHKGAISGVKKAIRGGDSWSEVDHCGVSFRNDILSNRYPEFTDKYTGFRLAL